ncbi:MAG TPA: TIGR04211 family SH3 domain-containing protein [Thiotrichales bacterium]|nr:TIGR04211 family SH3 domain-containing protein [Thiotrichales bacterium]
MIARMLIPLLLVALTGTALAGETVYVTDRLYLGLHKEPGASGKPLRTLVSGTRLELLERKTNYARVRLPDGSSGWVKSAFLVTEKPPRLVLDELTGEAKRLREENATLTRQAREATAHLAQLEQQAREATRRADEAEVRAGETEERLRLLLEQIASRGYAVPWQWALGGILVALTAGFLFGLWWLDRRIRQRHGGFRV